MKAAASCSGALHYFWLGLVPNGIIFNFAHVGYVGQIVTDIMPDTTPNVTTSKPNESLPMEATAPAESVPKTSRVSGRVTNKPARHQDCV